MGYVGKEYDGQINENLHPAGYELRPAYRDRGKPRGHKSFGWQRVAG
jgi:hypothetical protein